MPNISETEIDGEPSSMILELFDLKQGEEVINDEFRCHSLEPWLILPSLSQQPLSTKWRNQREDQTGGKVTSLVEKDSSQRSSPGIDSQNRQDRFSEVMPELSGHSSENELSPLSHSLENTGHDIRQVLYTESTKAPTSSCKSVLTHEASTSEKLTGARPKARASPKATKKVKWSNTVNSNTIIDEATYRHYRNLLLALRIPNDFVNSAAMKAVLVMLDNECHDQTLITLATNKLRVQHNRYPSAQELYLELTENENEKPIVISFIEECQTERGILVINKLFSESSSAEQQEDHHHNGSFHNTFQHAVLSTSQPFSTDKTSDINSMKDAIDETRDFNTIKDPTIIAIDEISDLNTINDSTLFATGGTKELKMSKDTQIRDLVHQQIKILKKEQVYLKQRLTCVDCKVKPAEVIFLPCGHFSLCATCSDVRNICPVCKKIALGEVKTYLC